MVDKPLSLKSSRTLQITYNLPISRTSKFWEGLKEGKVYATTCQKCGVLHFPPVADCGECGSSEVEWTKLDGEGEIVTFTQVFVKPASFSKEPPYIVAVAQLKEGIKALAWLTGIKREKVKAGMKVKLVAKVFSDKVAYEFVPL
ncbi:MAG: Zn-ribbon domain-containing OB-fold protein [Candidatus Bathyarchaeota archaeon]|nr:Zn-ribbon domain-containing OB-fold protein [Candidatus Bathyarchaeum sp.]